MIRAFKNLFVDHPREVDESYLHHMAASSRFGFRLLKLSGLAFLHALVLSNVDDPAGPFSADAIFRAVTAALSAVRRVRADHGIARSSSVNLVVSDGRNMVATRFTFDFGCFEKPPFQGGIEFLSQWFTIGERYDFTDGEWKMTGGHGTGTLVASEPLTRDVSTWVEVPEYGALLVGGGDVPTRRIETIDC